MISRKDIIHKLSKDFDSSKTLMAEIFDNIVDQMKNELLKGSDVVLREFVTLSVKNAVGRTVVSPGNGIESQCKDYKKVKACFSKKFRSLVKNS